MTELKTQSDKAPPNVPPKVATNADGPIGDILDGINQLIKKGESLETLANLVDNQSEKGIM